MKENNLENNSQKIIEQGEREEKLIEEKRKILGKENDIHNLIGTHLKELNELWSNPGFASKDGEEEYLGNYAQALERILVERILELGFEASELDDNEKEIIKKYLGIGDLGDLQEKVAKMADMPWRF